MSAKTHTHGTNREKPKQALEQKVVFKGVLDNPFRIHWPSVPVNLQNLVLAQILSLLEGVPQYQLARSQANRKRKREETGKTRLLKKRKVDEPAGGKDVADSPVAAAAAASPSTTEMQVDGPVIPDPPPILGHLTIGINEVTKRLEALVRTRRGGSIADNASVVPSVKLLLVCRADVNPPILIDHLPHLVAAYNSSKAPDPILLIPLPQGAELSLAQSMGVRRVAVIAVHSSAPELSNILSLVGSVPVLTASWLAAQSAALEEKRPTPIIPTHIKQLRTTAPKDMKAAREQRATGRAAAKERKKAISKKPAS